MSKNPCRRVAAAALVSAAALVVAAACTSEPVVWTISAEMGEPLPGLSPRELDRFELGRALFAKRFTPEEGLGPRFNEDACNACHTFPADGGTGETNLIRASRALPDGGCDLLSALGGENVRRSVTPAARALGEGRTPTPTGATHVGVFTIPFLFGLGVIDAVPQETLDALADPEDADGNGISGRVGRDPRGRPARFGRKADVATVRDFVENAFRLEMGLTTPSHPDEAAAGSAPAVPAEADPAPEPEVDASVVDAVTDFIRMLAPPAPAVPQEGERTTVERGRGLFVSLGCTSCHVPTLVAGESDIPAISGRAVALYSDLLLHDMGAGLEGPCAPGAAPREVRTEPLVGLRYREAFLHDGRAGRVIDAILAHGGEAQRARDAFAALDRVTQESLLRWLDTL